MALKPTELMLRQAKYNEQLREIEERRKQDNKSKRVPNMNWAEISPLFTGKPEAAPAAPCSPAQTSGSPQPDNAGPNPLVPLQAEPEGQGRG